MVLWRVGSGVRFLVDETLWMVRLFVRLVAGRSLASGSECCWMVMDAVGSGEEEKRRKRVRIRGPELRIYSCQQDAILNDGKENLCT